MGLFPRGSALPTGADDPVAQGDRPAALWPSACAVCRHWPAAPICPACTARFAAPVSRCRGCGLRVAGGAAWCGECAREAPPFEACVAALDYAFPWDGLINDLKHHDRLDLAPALADLLASAVAARRSPAPPAAHDPGHPALPACDLVVPVPLSPARLRERGHNQAWELARRAARTLGLPARADLLDRVHDGAAQQGLGRNQRLANLGGAFVLAAQARAQMAGRRIALVDDVMTTGATLREAAATLRRGGAAAVQAWVLARTPAA